MSAYLLKTPLSLLILLEQGVVKLYSRETPMRLRTVNEPFVQLKCPFVFRVNIVINSKDFAVMRRAR